MRSRAAIGNHPLHPAFVVVPIGAFFGAFVGDLIYSGTQAVFWYQFALYNMVIGVIGALVAAVFGLIDYFGVRMSDGGRRIANIHLSINLSVVVAYLINLWLRWDNAALFGARWTLAFWLQVLSFLALAVSGWLGGKLAYEHKVGVVEYADPEAKEIGEREQPAPGERVIPGRRRGVQP